MIQAHGTDTSGLAAGITAVGAKKIAEKREAARQALELEKEQRANDEWKVREDIRHKNVMEEYDKQLEIKKAEQEGLTTRKQLEEEGKNYRAHQTHLTQNAKYRNQKKKPKKPKAGVKK